MNKEKKRFSWVIYSQLFQIVSQLINIVFITSLFTPNDYGIFAIGMIIITIVNQLFILGFSAPLIQFDNHNKFYGTAWTFNLLVSIFVTILLISIIPTILNLFFPKYLDYVFLFQLLSVTVLISGLGNIGVIELYRKRQTNKLFYLRGFMELLKIGITFLFYFIFKDYRSLFFAFISASFIQLILTYSIAPNKSKIEINFTLLKELFNFSIWLQLKNLTKVISTNLDSIIIASLLSPVSLGNYNRSMTISKAPEQISSNINDMYSYPWISNNKDDYTFLKSYFESFMIILIFLFSNLALIVYIFGREIIELVLGESWTGIYEPLRILIFAMLVSSVLNSLFPFIRAKGYPKIEFKLFIIKTLFLVALCYPLILNFGLLGAAFSNLISLLLVFPFFIYEAKKIIGSFIKILYPIMAIFFITSLPIILFYNFQYTNIISLILDAFLLLLLYDIIIVLIIKRFYPSINLVIYINSIFKRK